jgi:hypothetical protein
VRGVADGNVIEAQILYREYREQFPDRVVLGKGIFGYLWRAPLKVDRCRYVPTSITESYNKYFSCNFEKLLRVNERPKQKNIFSSCSMITVNCLPSLVSVLFDTPDICMYIVALQAI